MTRKTISVFEKDYETLLLRAGDPDKIAFVVRSLVEIAECFEKDQQDLGAWKWRPRQPLLPPK